MNYDYDDVENPSPPIELARKRLEDFVTNWGDGELMDVRGGNGDYESVYPLHTRDIGALLETLGRAEEWANDRAAGRWYDSAYADAQEHASNILRGFKPRGERR